MINTPNMQRALQGLGSTIVRDLIETSKICSFFYSGRNATNEAV
jgi:hypothetical protein